MERGSRTSAPRVSPGGNRGSTGKDLFEVLRAELNVAEEDVLAVDYTDAQKKGLQKLKEGQIIERLDRRLGTTHNLIDGAPSPRKISPFQSPRNQRSSAQPHERGSALGMRAHERGSASKVNAAAAATATAAVAARHAQPSPADAEVPVRPSPRRPVSLQPTGTAAHAVPKVEVESLLAVPELGQAINQELESEPAAPASDAGTDASKANTTGSASHAGSEGKRGQSLDLKRSQTVETDIEAFGDLEQYSLVRRVAIKICTHADFEFVVMLAIMVNCVTLSLYNPIEPETSEWNEKLFWADLVLNIVYTIEMCLRIVALGPPWIWSYLSKPWNAFDAFMVAVGYTQFIPTDGGGANTSAIRALRALRALRPLRTITRFEALRAVVVCFLEAVPLLGAVVVMVMMFLFLYGMAAVQMFTDVYHNVCMGLDPNGSGQIVTEGQVRGEMDDPDMFGCSGELDPNPRQFWRSLRQCPYDMTCVTTSYSTATYTAGFDNVALAMLTEFQCLTLTSWSYIMYRTMDNSSPFASIYFLSLVMLGSYFLVHLFLAVLKTKFAKAQTIFVQAQRQNRKKKQNTFASMINAARNKLSEAVSRQSQSSVMNSVIASKLSARSAGSLDTPVLSEDNTEKPVSKENTAKLSGPQPASTGKPIAEGTEDKHITLAPDIATDDPPSGSVRSAPKKAPSRTFSSTARPSASGMKSATSLKRNISVRWDVPEPPSQQDNGDKSDARPSSPRRRGAAAASGNRPGSPMRMQGTRAPLRPQMNNGAGWNAMDGIPAKGSKGSRHLSSRNSSIASHESSSTYGGGGVLPLPQADMVEANLKPMILEGMAAQVMSIKEFDDFVADLPTAQKVYLRLQFRARKMVERPLFDNCFLIVILISTILLALEYDGMSDSQGQALWTANVVLTSLFTAEVALKVFALGFWDYIRDGFNIFDAVVVGLSLVEIVLAAVAGLGALRSMRALRIIRALRVLRLLKLFKYLNSLRKIGDVILNSMSSFAAIVLLLALFWLVFTIMGMHVFGGLPLQKPNDFPNFDTFLNAMLSTFNILNLENWNQQLYTVIQSSNYGTVAYYLIWIVIGKYTFLSLFLAVMLEAFEAKYDAGGGGNGVGTAVSGMSAIRSKMDSLAGSIAKSAQSIGDTHVTTMQSDRLSPKRASEARQKKLAGAAAEGKQHDSPGSDSHGIKAVRATAHEVLQITYPEVPAGQGQQTASKPVAEGVEDDALLPKLRFPPQPPPKADLSRPPSVRGATQASPRVIPDPRAPPSYPEAANLILDDGPASGRVMHGRRVQPVGGSGVQDVPIEEGRVRTPVHGRRAVAPEGNTPDGRPGSTLSPSGMGPVAIMSPTDMPVYTPTPPPPLESAPIIGVISLAPESRPSAVNLRQYAPGKIPASPFQAQPGPAGSEQLVPRPPSGLAPGASNAEAAGPRTQHNSQHDEQSLPRQPNARKGARRMSYQMLTWLEEPAAGEEAAPRPDPGPNALRRTVSMGRSDDELLRAPLTKDALKLLDSVGASEHSAHHYDRASMADTMKQLKTKASAETANTAAARSRRSSASSVESTKYFGSLKTKEPVELLKVTERDPAADEEELLLMSEMRSSASSAAWASEEPENYGKKGKRRKKLSPEEMFRLKQQRRNGAIMIEGSGEAFWYFDEDHPVRVWVYDRVTTRAYDYFMFVLITINCLAMAIENPFIEPGSTLDLILYWSDVGFVIVFGVEVLIKSFAFTFTLYIKELTNQVDFMIVCISVLILSLEAVTSNAQILTALRVLRAIKPLRMLTRSDGMRIVFKSLMLSMAAMANVSLVCVLFFLIFAILGTQLFMGLFWSCNDTSVSGIEECIGTYLDPDTGMLTDRQWTNAFPNFDNVGNSLLVCFITATLNGYTATMLQAMAAPQAKGLQPQRNQNPGAFFWFAGFVFVCAFTLINLYVGVIFSQFSKIRLMSQTGSAFLSTDQNEWAELSKMVFKLKPPEKPLPPKNFFRRLCFHITNSRMYDTTINAAVLANTACLAVQHYDMPLTMKSNLELANYVFVAVFTSEMLLKIAAVGYKAYWQEKWNRLDTFLVGLALLDIIISAVQVNFLRALRVLRIQRLMRAFRAVQILRVAKAAANLRSLFATLVAAVPAFGNVGSLIGLIFFMYAYVGVYEFGDLKWNLGINEHANFRNFLQAALLLMRVATGDNWSNILSDCINQSNCDRETENCGSYVAIPYFLSFVLLVSVILLNLFTAVIVETFEKTHEQQEWKLSPTALEDFSSLWSEYDNGSGTIAPRDLEELLIRLEPPLGLGNLADNKDVLRFVYDLDIPLVNGRVPFHKTIFELVKRVSQSNIPEGALKEQLDRLVEKFFNSLNTEGALNFSAAVSVSRVQRSWRAKTRAGKLKRKKQWRTARDCAPNYTTVCEEKPQIVSAYQVLKEAEKNMFGLNTNMGNYVCRWRFNPALISTADEFEKNAMTAAKKLKNLMTLWRGNNNKVAPSLIGSGFTTAQNSMTEEDMNAQPSRRFSSSMPDAQAMAPSTGSSVPVAPTGIRSRRASVIDMLSGVLPLMGLDSPKLGMMGRRSSTTGLETAPASPTAAGGRGGDNQPSQPKAEADDARIAL